MRESARPDLWEPRPGNRSGPPDRSVTRPDTRLHCCAAASSLRCRRYPVTRATSPCFGVKCAPAAPTAQQHRRTPGIAP